MDLLLRGATVVDGTGGPSRRAVAACRLGVSGGRIVAVGDADPPSGAVVVDLDGLVLAPGFADIHTHYDAQVLWGPDLTPSSWHGVTTVVMGNCGFGIAPTRPERRSLVARTRENVEGMSAAALEARGCGRWRPRRSRRARSGSPRRSRPPMPGPAAACCR